MPNISNRVLNNPAIAFLDVVKKIIYIKNKRIKNKINFYS